MQPDGSCQLSGAETSQAIGDESMFPVHCPVNRLDADETSRSHKVPLLLAVRFCGVDVHVIEKDIALMRILCPGIQSIAFSSVSPWTAKNC
jgi:hypothetical protein